MMLKMLKSWVFSARIFFSRPPPHLRFDDTTFQVQQSIGTIHFLLSGIALKNSSFSLWDNILSYWFDMERYFIERISTTTLLLSRNSLNLFFK